MNKHTQGPWTVAGAYIFSNDDLSVAMAPRVGSEWNANAILIAAAPEMLAALKDALQELESHYDAAYCEMGVAHSEIESIKAVIAKAEGQS